MIFLYSAPPVFVVWGVGSFFSCARVVLLGRLVYFYECPCVLFLCCALFALRGLFCILCGEYVNGERRKNPYPYLGENRANPLPPICHNISLFLLQAMAMRNGNGPLNGPRACNFSALARKGTTVFPRRQPIQGNRQIHGP